MLEVKGRRVGKEEALCGWEYKEEEASHTHKHELASGPECKQKAGGEQTQSWAGCCQFQIKVSRWCWVCQQNLLASRLIWQQVGRTCVIKHTTTFASARQHTAGLSRNEKAMQHLMSTEVSVSADIWSEHDLSLTVSWKMYDWCDHIQTN